MGVAEHFYGIFFSGFWCLTFFDSHVVRSRGSSDTVGGFYHTRHLAQFVNKTLGDVGAFIDKPIACVRSLKLLQVFVHTNVEQTSIRGHLEHLAQLDVLYFTEVNIANANLLNHSVRGEQVFPSPGVVVEVCPKTRHANHQRLHQVLDVVRRVGCKLHYRGHRHRTVLVRRCRLIKVGRVVASEGVEHVLPDTLLGHSILGFLLHRVEHTIGFATVLHVGEKPGFSSCVR